MSLIVKEEGEINFLSTVELFISLVVFRMRLEKANLPRFNIAFSKEGLSFLEDIKDNCPPFHDWPIKSRDIDRIKEFNPDLPTIMVKNHYLFFFNMYKLSLNYIAYQHHYSERSADALQIDLLEKIWLRMIPNDLNNIEDFLYREAKAYQDDTFRFIDDWTKVGTLLNYDIKVKNTSGTLYDENVNEMHIRIYDGDEYHSLPRIHYDVIGDTCYIGAIQSEKDDTHYLKDFKRMLYRLNNQVFDSESKEYHAYKKGESDYYPENISDVHPNFIMALTIFFDLLSSQGITKVKVPFLHVLSYDHHHLLSQEYEKYFTQMHGSYEMYAHKSKEELKRLFAYDNYEYETFMANKKLYDHYVGKEDFISRAKTENLIRLFRRMQFHFPDIVIKTETPLEGDYMILYIPVNSKTKQISKQLIKKSS